MSEKEKPDDEWTVRCQGNVFVGPGFTTWTCYECGETGDGDTAELWAHADKHRAQEKRAKV